MNTSFYISWFPFGRNNLNALVVAAIAVFGLFLGNDAEAQDGRFGIAIHGGAGTILKSNMSDSLEELYTQKLTEAIKAGYAKLEEDASAEEAVIAAIKILENSPLFNAGKGSVYTHDETHEMDASLMLGHDLSTGAVAGLSGIKNPILAAQAVKDRSPHVLLSGDGARRFAITSGLDTVPPEYFHTESRMKALEEVKRAEEDQGAIIHSDWKYGTVGAVALDKQGHLAAGTSTGGMTNKRHGRIGDSPIVGAGTWADSLVAVSCTGHGEYFIRYSVARDLAARMAYKGESLDKAGTQIIYAVLQNAGGSGGLIAIDKDGNVSMPFNTPGMYRGHHISGDPIYVGLYTEKARK